jgi:pimeloyl-ACP methyl ester carboxylesterase
VANWLDRNDLPPVVLIGHSSGTQTAARVAVLRPERVATLVLASPTIDPAYRSWSRAILHWRLDSRFPLPGLEENHIPEWKRAGPRQIVHLLSVHLADRLEEVVPAAARGASTLCPLWMMRRSKTSGTRCATCSYGNRPGRPVSGHGSPGSRWTPYPIDAEVPTMLPITADQLVTAPHDPIEDPAIVQAQRARATRVVASAAADAGDCALLLDALGLRPEDGRGEPPAPRRGS